MIKDKENWKKFREVLLLKKMSSKNLAAYLYVFKLFSSLRFFKVNKKPFDAFKYLSDVCLKSTLYSLYFLYFLDFFKGISFHLKKALRLKILKKKYFNIARIFKEWKKRVYIIRKSSFNDLKYFTKLKFKGKKIEKIRYLEDHAIVDKKKIKKTRLEKMYDTNAYFVNTLLENRFKLKVKHYSIKRVFKKVTKKIFKFLKKNKKRTLPLLLKKLAFHLTYIKQKRRKGQKKKFLKIWLRHKYEGKFKEREAAAKELYKSFYTDEEKIKWYLKDRRKKFWRKYFLIKKYKRIVFRRKRRTGILHFRMYYSNYYVTLTDLSHNVIFTCSAGSVSSGANKKTKMSNVVAIPIFFRIIFFLRAFKIRNLKFVFRARMDKMFFIALHFFQNRGYKIKSYSMVHKAPHHLGQRKQKPRRI